jgi:hypothetical protein
MTPLLTLRAALALAGVAVFLYGARTDLTQVRWVGIALLGIAFLLRFLDRPRPR